MYVRACICINRINTHAYQRTHNQHSHDNVTLVRSYDSFSNDQPLGRAEWGPLYRTLLELRRFKVVLFQRQVRLFICMYISRMHTTCIQYLYDAYNSPIFLAFAYMQTVFVYVHIVVTCICMRAQYIRVFVCVHSMYVYLYGYIVYTCICMRAYSIYVYLYGYIVYTCICMRS